MTRRSVSIDREEFKKIKDFIDVHYHSNVFFIENEPTGVGEVVYVQCGQCMEIANVTNYDSW